MTKGSYLIIRRGALCEDSWTYGDWRQYIAFRDNGDACCVRMSVLPSILAMLGASLLAVVAVAAQGVLVRWPVMAFYAFLGFALCGPALVQLLTDWRLVVVVLTCTRKGEGRWERDL